MCFHNTSLFFKKDGSTELIKNHPDSEFKDRLKTAQTVWEDFSNSRKAEEEAT